MMIHTTPPPPHVANGVYYYGTRGMAEWQITISDDGRRIVDESTENTRLPSYEIIRFDPKTFSVTSSRSHLGGPGMWISSRSRGSATVQHTSGRTCEGMPKAICSRPHAIVTPMPGTKRIVPFEPYLLPFIIVRSGERKFTLAPGSMLWVAGSCASTKPRAYPKDACLHISWNNTADTPSDAPTSEDLWFNPMTYVLDRYQVAGESPTDRLICFDANTCRDPNGE
uniref:Uncharacterized protein n=1 Tax=mine drainage metagenome TaxID=410659 RepID=E6Q4I8_9ZZZZ